jgi:hypothetical protein
MYFPVTVGAQTLTLRDLLQDRLFASVFPHLRDGILFFGRV